MLFKSSSVLAAILGFTLSQPVLGDWAKGASAELAEKDGKCVFHFKNWPLAGCTGTQSHAGTSNKESIGKVKDGKCTSSEDSAVFFVSYCNLDLKPGIVYSFKGKKEGKLLGGPNDTSVPIDFDIGNKAVWDGHKWDVSKK